MALILFYAAHLERAGAFAAPLQPPVRDAPTAGSAKSYVELFDPTTNVHVVLLGCLHGSLSSSRDLRSLMERERTDAVVLELCETRLRDLTRDAVEDYTAAIFWEDVRDFGAFVRDTGEKQGTVAAAVTLMLGLTSLLQTNISGIRAGLEFAVALDVAEENGCGVFLGDRGIDETMERLSNLPSVAVDMIRNNTAFADTKLLRTAVFGDRSLPRNTQISLPKTLVRNKGAVTDLARIALPPVLIATVFALSVGSALDLPLYAEQDSVSLLMDSASLLTFDERWQIALEIISKVPAEMVVFAAGYTALALPASKVIIHERDVCLAAGIHEASRAGAGPAGPKESRLVAVLGLLHVNGVAKQLLDRGAVPVPSKD